MTAPSPESQAPGRRKAPTPDELAAAVVLSLQRLVKQSTLYDADNEAQIRAIDIARKAANVYGRRMGANPTVFFTERSIFVGGRLLRAGRSVYAAALELGKLFARFGIDELAIGYDVTAEDLMKLQAAIRDALRGKGSPAGQRYARIRLRRGKNPAERDARLSPEERVLRAYASAVVVMRRFLEALQQGRTRLPQQVRRVAMQIADLSAVDTPAFLGSLAINNMQHEHAARAVNAALLAVGMARQLTSSRPLLARVATAALLFDVGLPRVAGAGPTGEGRVGMALPRLVDHQLAELPAAGAAMSWALGGFSIPAMTHTVLVYEALGVAYREHTEPAYGKLRHPTLAARIVGAARRFTELLADPDEQLSPDGALCRMLQQAADEADKTVARLLISALGVFPTGSMVQLSNGCIAQVVQVPDDPLHFASPVVRPVLDAAGAGLAGVPDIDLRSTGDIHVTRVVEVGDGTQVRQRSTAEQALARGDVSAPAIAPRETPAAPQPPAPPGGVDSGPLASLETPTGIARSAAEARMAETEEFELELEDDEDDPRAREDEDDIPSMLVDALIQPADPEPAEPVASDTEGTAVFARAHGAALAQLAAPEPAIRRDDADEARADAAEDEDEEAATPPRPPTRAPLATPLAADRAPIATPLPAERAPIAPPLRQQPRADARPAAPTATRARPEVAPVSVDWLRTKIAGKRPKAQGQFIKTPLVHLLIYALDQRLTGTMVIVAPDRVTYAIYFDDGVPAKVRTGKMVAPLDRVLLDFGVVDQATLQASLIAISRSGELHGAYLMGQGHLNAETLDAALKWQLLRKMTHMLALPADTRYAYYDGDNLLDDYAGPETHPVEPLLLIMTGVRLMGHSRTPDEMLARLGEAPLRLVREAVTARFGFKAQERAIVDLLRARPQSLRELLLRDAAEERVVKTTIYALMITRCLKLSADQRPPAGYGRPVIPMPPLGNRGQPSPPRTPASPPKPAARAAAARPASRIVSPPTSRRAISSPGPAEAEVVPLDEPSEPNARRPSSAGLPRRGASTSRASMPRHGTSSARGQVPTHRATRASHPNAANVAAVRRISNTGKGKHKKSTPSPSSKPNVAKLTNPDALTRVTIDALHQSIDEMTCYEILGVSPKSEKDAIQSAYFKLAKIWHPDRLPAEVRDLRSKVAKIFARMNEANHTLGDAQRRREYDQVLLSGGGTVKDREMVEKVVDSALLFQKAEVLLRMGHKRDAEVMLKQAAEADPGQPEYMTLLAWVEAENKGPPPGLAEGQRSDHYREQIRRLDEVIEREPSYERAIFYRGMLLKQSGQLDRAIRDFRQAAKLNPRNIDAKREVRVFEMRKQRTTGGGLLGKLFGKSED